MTKIVPVLLVPVLLLVGGCGGAAATGPADPGDGPNGPNGPNGPEAEEEVAPAAEERVVEEETVERRTIADEDGDGVADGDDLCPGDPEDRDGDRDEDGCPESSIADAPIAPDPPRDRAPD